MPKTVGVAVSNATFHFESKIIACVSHKPTKTRNAADS